MYFMCMHGYWKQGIAIKEECCLAENGTIYDVLLQG